ncbi:hypothetical protein ACFQV4_08350 [Streptomyces thermocarboxydus]
MTAHDKDPFRKDTGHEGHGHDALAAALFDEAPPEGRTPGSSRRGTPRSPISRCSRSS